MHTSCWAYVCSLQVLYMYIPTYIYSCLYMYVHVHIHAHKCIYINVNVYVYVYIYVYIHMYIYIYTYIHIYICLYVYLIMHMYKQMSNWRQQYAHCVCVPHTLLSVVFVFFGIWYKTTHVYVEFFLFLWCSQLCFQDSAQRASGNFTTRVNADIIYKYVYRYKYICISYSDICKYTCVCIYMQLCFQNTVQCASSSIMTRAYSDIV